MTRFGAALMATVLLLSGCTSETTPEGFSCVEPPATEVTADSDLVLAVEPNPVDAGREATLSLERGDLSAYVVAGAGVLWQCWTREEGWTDTHVIVRGHNARSMQTAAIETGSPIFVDLIGLGIPNSYRILIPNVAPGTYRIVDRVNENRVEVTGFVIVEVRGRPRDPHLD